MKKDIHLIIDFDSTIVSCETLDELSNISLQNDLKKNNQIKNITDRAMNGEVGFSKALDDRLEILNISKEYILHLITIIKQKISNTFLENIDFIKQNNNNIYIVSGGFSEFINPIAHILGIKSNHIFSNSFIKKNNKYKLDKKNIMAYDKGKVEIVKSLNLIGTTIVIGDGYTDYEVKEYGHADIFIAYTEHVNRSKVSNLADYKSDSFNDIINYINSL